MCIKTAEKAQIRYVQGVIDHLTRQFHALQNHGQNHGTGLSISFGKTAGKTQILRRAFSQNLTTKNTANTVCFERKRLQKQITHYQQTLAHIIHAQDAPEFTLAV